MTTYSQLPSFFSEVNPFALGRRRETTEFDAKKDYAYVKDTSRDFDRDNNDLAEDLRIYGFSHILSETGCTTIDDDKDVERTFFYNFGDIFGGTEKPEYVPQETQKLHEALHQRKVVFHSEFIFNDEELNTILCYAFAGFVTIGFCFLTTNGVAPVGHYLSLNEIIEAKEKLDARRRTEKGSVSVLGFTANALSKGQEEEFTVQLKPNGGEILNVPEKATSADALKSVFNTVDSSECKFFIAFYLEHLLGDMKVILPKMWYDGVSFGYRKANGDLEKLLFDDSDFGKMLRTSIKVLTSSGLAHLLIHLATSEIIHDYASQYKCKAGSYTKDRNEKIDKIASRTRFSWMDVSAVARLVSAEDDDTTALRTMKGKVHGTKKDKLELLSELREMDMLKAPADHNATVGQRKTLVESFVDGIKS